MSKQLAISAAFSILAMSAFALFGTAQPAAAGDHGQMVGGQMTGAKAQASAPAIGHYVPAQAFFGPLISE
ncbi:hypothetical protein GCM10009127_11930 [Alteraurantiacibacter aestuarii]|uniref:Uncharacterized protein n=1 Tax=Alteraurantiacibacter aestuarii TaxID=650004 RepID=A0A844ZPL5_9SPHN|nr:hypothetical protein [Alteraurantiacibacter aestuarii]MXO87579.1 hypothetical protein [Alteraurantiacibacter aestuarii]